MSIVSFAIRLAAARILRDKTWAEDAILISPVAPITEVLRRADPSPKPVIGVFTSETSSKPDGRDVGGKDNKVEITFFIYLPPIIRPLPDGTIGLGVQASAMSLDIVARQIMNELRGSTSPWKAVWDKLTVAVVEHDSKPVLVELDQGVRVACLEIRMAMSVIPEPPPGRPLYSVWLTLDGLLREDPETEPLADAIKSAIEYDTSLPAWRVTQIRMAYSAAAARAAGFTPADETETGEPSELDEIEFSGENTVGTFGDV
jgi:hypothetical protein